MNDRAQPDADRRSGDAVARAWRPRSVPKIRALNAYPVAKATA